MLLMLFAMMIQLTASCPSSCVVCSEDITLCQGLTYILAVAASTKALIITDGSITSVEGFNLSFLLNATLLRLSTNGITTIRDDAFLGLRMLKTLHLDQNQISATSITYSTFHELQKLQVLVLSNNILSTIHGTWFRNMKDLIKLNLNGNQLSSITSDSFKMANLGKLRILDLSNNFINSIQKRAFHGLTQLTEIDLSRNRLAAIPDTFSPLTQLSRLNLDQNWWNCTCKLYDLASFLRKYMNSSSRTLRNADNMSCRASENPSVINLLELTEVNCKSALKHPPGVLTNRRTNYGRDIALVAIFSILGGAGLTCLVLALFNRKLQHSKANEHSSENCCCRTLDESQCGCKPRNYHTKGYCNCQLTRENEIKVMSTLGSGRDMPLLKENNYQERAKAECKCTGLKMPCRSTEKEKEQMKNDKFFCFNCGLLQSHLQESSGNIAVPNEVDIPHSKHVQRTVGSPENFGPWEEDSLSTRSQNHPRFNQGIRSDTLCGRCSRLACVLAKERPGKHLANKLCQPLSQTENRDYSKPHKQRHVITAFSSTTNAPEGPKKHHGTPGLESCVSRQNDRCGLLDRNKNISSQLENFLFCKYIDCDKHQETHTGKKWHHEKQFRLEKEESEVKSRRPGGCYMSDGEVPLSPGVKKMYQPKSVSFYVPDLGTVKRADTETASSNEERTLENRPQCEYIQGNPSSPLARRLLSDLEAKNEKRKSSPIPVGPEGKENELTQKKKIKTKREDSLNVKLNLHPFGKARVYPEELLPKENREQCQCCQNIKFPHASKEEETRKKRKTKSEESVAAKKMSGSSKETIYSRVVVGKLPEENDKISAPSIPDLSRSITEMRNTEDTLLAKNVETPSCSCRSPPLSPNRTSRMSISVTSLSSDHSPNISQKTTNDVPISANSKEEDATEMAVLPFHQQITMKKDHFLSLSLFSPVEKPDLQTSDMEGDLQPQKTTENIMQNTKLDQLGQQQLKRQSESPPMKDELDLLKECPQGNVVSLESHRFEEILSLDGDQIPIEKDTSLLKCSAHLSGALSDSQANECLTTREGTQKQDGTKDIEGYRTEMIQLTEDSKPERNIELTEMLISDTPRDSLGLKTEETQPVNKWENNKHKTLHKNIVEVTIISNVPSVASSPKTGNTHLDGNNLEMNNNIPIGNDSDLQEAPNNQPDEGSSEHKESKMPPATHQKSSLLSQFKDISFKEQTEMSLLPCKINKDEISVPQPTLSPTSTDYDKELSLQVEQCKANISNNTYPLILFKDKKPLSI